MNDYEIVKMFEKADELELPPGELRPEDLEKKCYLVHYTKDGNYINIQVYAENEDKACEKADAKFYTTYNRDAIAGFQFDYVEEIKARDSK